MKTLVVYYSRNGHTKKIGTKIIKKINADTDEVIDLVDRHRKIVGWLISGRDAALRKTTKIKYKKDPSEYDLVIIGTPIWSWTLTPAIRTYLMENKFKKVVFFCTSGGQKGNVFRAMKKLSKEPLAVFEIMDREVKKDQFQKQVDELCKTLKNIS